MGLIQDYYTEDFWKIYRQIKRYTGFYLSFIPFDDVAQEILAAIISSPGNELSVASCNVKRLIKDYGFNMFLKTTDVNLSSDWYDDHDSSLYNEWVQKTAEEVKNLYRQKTAKQVLDHFGVPHSSYSLVSIARILGGKRKPYKKEVVAYNEELAEKIYAENKVSRNAFRQWKYQGYIPKKFLKPSGGVNNL